MDDQLVRVEKRLEDLQREVVESRREIAVLLGRGFKWTIATLAVAIVITWFGVFIFLTKGATALSQLLKHF